MLKVSAIHIMATEQNLCSFAYAFIISMAQYSSLYQLWQGRRHQGMRQLAVLIDPDKATPEHIEHICNACNSHHVDMIFAGGSYLINGNIDHTVNTIKKHTQIPVVIFPGTAMQISSHADAILFLSLISGRNPDLLIGQQVAAAPHIKKAGIEPIATGYMLVESGPLTTAHYLSGSMPLPRHKYDLAAGTALAAQMLGMQCVYLDAGSGAQHTIAPAMIEAVRQQINIPIIVGGGIRHADIATQFYAAGADILVIGTAAELAIENIAAIKTASNALHQ